MWKYCDNNKCHNIFTKHLFSVVIGYNFIFYYFISTYKKFDTSIIVKILWNLLCQYNNIYASLYKYLKEKKNFRHYSYRASWINQKHYTISVVTFFQNILFLVVVGHKLTISYFIILFLLVRNWHVNNCEICCVSITIYMPVYINI